MNFPPVHRVVTGHRVDGSAYAFSDGPLATVTELTAVPGTIFHEVWSTTGTPAPVDNQQDPTIGPLCLPPPINGTRIRFVDIPPDTPESLRHAKENAGSAFSQLGDPTASTGRLNAPHPLMHRTETIDYGVVIDGEITLVLDEGEVQLRPGSVVIQRGTNHAWANRSGRPCRMLFVLVDGRYDATISDSFALHRS